MKIVFMKCRKRNGTLIAQILFYCLLSCHSLYAQQFIDLTFESAIDIAMENSYRIRQLQLGIERQRYSLKAHRAGLKSRVYMDLKSPEIKSISETKWNSTLQMDEIVRQDNRRWQMDLSIRQPVILFGYPTNGYLSLNNTLYRYLQKIDSSKEVDYYNRYFVKFEQPILQPNRLKYNIEEAELNLESDELRFLQNQVWLLTRTGYNYYEMFRLSYMDVIYSHALKNLQKVSDIVNTIIQQDSTRSIEARRIQVELANVREKIMENQSDLRLQSARMKQSLMLNYEDSLNVKPTIEITPINVDINMAIQYGYTLRPTMRTWEIRKRYDERNLEEAKSLNAFHIDLEMTYGLEKKDEYYHDLWEKQDNSYSVSLRAYIPIWDWGQRKNWINSSKISLKKNELYMEEDRKEIETEITNAIVNLEEYQTRALKMKENMDTAQEISAISIEQYRDNKISLQDIIQIIERQGETEYNFLEAYLGYKRSLLRLMENTYYDFENDISLRDRFYQM